MIQIVGYGSFMIQESLQKTISGKKYRLVWVKDYKRVFNLRTRLFRMYKVREQTNEVAVANVEASPGSRLNAVLFEVDEEEFEKLKIRERIYYPKQITVYDFDDEQELGPAMIFIGKKLFHGERIVSNDYLPIQSYLERCRDAAYKIGKRFGEAFDETTFLGDGSSVKQYYKKKNI